MDLKDYFAQNPRAALAFSGGVDSAYLLYAGLHLGAELHPYYVKTQFQPDFEFRDAMRLCEQLGAEPTVLRLDALEDPMVRRNGPDRCYFCKRRIMGAILEKAAEDGYSLLLDGTNASDDSGDRPGMWALRELKVQSPLRLCGRTKPEIRRLSKEAGLFTWNKPAYACLATRVKTGEALEEETLRRVEAAEDCLGRMGFRDLRVRTAGGRATLQFIREQLAEAREREKEIRTGLSGLFDAVEIDPEERKKSL